MDLSPPISFAFKSNTTLPTVMLLALKVRMKRRDFLKFGGALAAQSLIASTFLDSLWIPTAKGGSVSVRDLNSALNPAEAVVLVPQDAKFAAYQSAFNKRTLQTPLVRVLCQTPASVAVAVQWAQANDVRVVMRSGGHSFEGLSQGNGLVIDTRLMNHIVLSSDKQSFVVGAGSMLGNVYGELSKSGLAIPAGSCPTVGITGHTMGGGYGLLSRPYGLACDSLISAVIVNAKGQILNCSETENQDLFWALRGGGAGSFGIVTELHFKTHKVSSVRVYSAGWKVKGSIAAHLMKTWQLWAPNSSREITSLLKISRIGADLFAVRCIGQTIGSEADLRKELAHVTVVAPPDSLTIKNLSFMDAVKHFGGSFEASSIFMKGKSDYLKKPMSDEGLGAFLQKIPPGIDVIFDSYGGAIGDVKEDATAFAHREGTLSSLQYYTQWENEADGKVKLFNMRNFHDAMRPYMSGSAYFNYCDLDIKDYPTAYWGANADRLSQIKTFHDPQNFFAHAQSVPLKK